MSGFVPDVGEVRDSLVYLNKYHAKQYGDVDLMVVGSETAAQFDRMIAEVRREAAEKALINAADAAPIYARGCEPSNYPRGWLRARAEAYRQERKER